jgi:hypothetical protein
MFVSYTNAAAKLAKFPAELKAVQRWVCWKYETRDGKATKVLYNPETHQRASSTDPSTWSDYTTAVSAAAMRDYAGVGFVIASPYAAVDLDKCRDAVTGVVEPWATDVISQLNSYTELSPSGCGFHIWINGCVPAGGNRRGRVEMYDSGRYFTVTGDHVPGTPLTVEARDLTALHTRMLAGKLEDPVASTPAARVSMDARRNTMLVKPSRDDLIAGRWQGYYGSQSEADLALCVLLAEDSSGDAGKIDAAFRASALLRSKWDEKHGATTYGDRTIERAIKFWRGNGAICTVVEEEPEANTPTVPVYPAEAIDGDYIGDLTHLLTDGTAIPPQFVRETAKCILGAVIDGHVGFPGHEDLHTRLYSINVSLYPRTGKGEAWKRTGDYQHGVLHSLLTHCEIKVIDGGLFGSGEWMTKILCGLEQTRRPSEVLVRLDEMFEVFEKAKATGSTLESKLLQMYERNAISSGSFKNGEHQVTDTHLSLSGDFTRDKFQTTFAGRGSAGSGFLARCTLSYGDRVAHVGDWVETNKIAVMQTMTSIDCCTDTIRHAKVRLIPEETEEARNLRWDFLNQLRKDESRYVAELEPHFKRDLLTRVCFSSDTRIDVAQVRKSIVWTQHQLEVRKELWPEDAGGPVEQMEQRIIRSLTTKGTLSLKRLKDFCNLRRGGSGGYEVFNRALRALTLSREVIVIGESQRGAPVYSLGVS